MQMSALLSTHITLQLSPVAQAPGQPSNLGELLKQANEMVRNGEKKMKCLFKKKTPVQALPSAMLQAQRSTNCLKWSAFAL